MSGGRGSGGRESGGDSLEELALTQDELRRLGDAFKKEDFRRLFAEYAEEIADPVNRARYESEIRQLEAERGMDVKFVNPQPGYVIKSSVDGQRKAFINICTNENIGRPSSEPRRRGSDNGGGAGEVSGLCWTIPHSFSQPRDDLARGGAKCRVFNFVVHPDTYRLAETNTRFRKMVNDLALEGVQRQFDVKLDTKNLKFPKMKYKGVPTPTVIRTRLKEGAPQQGSDATQRHLDPDDIMSKFPYPYDNLSTEERTRKAEEEHARKANVQKDKKTQRKGSGGVGRGASAQNAGSGSGEPGQGLRRTVCCTALRTKGAFDD